MKKFVLTLTFVLSIILLNSQESGVRTIKVLGNKVVFKPLIHASIYFEINGKTIYVDPWGDQSLYEGLKKADAILITDIHPDHYSKENIERIINENTFFIVPRAVFDLMPEEWQSRSSILNNGEQIRFKDQRLVIKAVPMYNIPEKETQPHIKGRGNGYILDVDDFKIYISGDTGDTPEIRSLNDIEVAFVCMNLPYTMSVDEAASAVKEFKPKKVFPYHYRNGDKSLSDIERFCHLVNSSEIVCVMLEWY